MVRDEPVRVFEEEFVAETFSGAGKLNHGSLLWSHTASGPAVSAKKSITMYDKIAVVKHTSAQGRGFVFPLPQGFGFGVAFALPTKARLFNRCRWDTPVPPAMYSIPPYGRDHD